MTQSITIYITRNMVNIPTQNRILYSFLIATLLLFSCKHQKEINKIQGPDFHELIKQKKFQLANKLVDSLISKHPVKGYYFFIKGTVQSDLDSFSNAIINYKKAYILNYKRDECLQEINLNERLAKVSDSIDRRK